MPIVVRTLGLAIIVATAAHGQAPSGRSTSSPDTVLVVGCVADSGLPVEGAKVRLHRTGEAVQTDSTGFFSLRVPRPSSTDTISIGRFGYTLLLLAIPTAVNGRVQFPSISLRPNLYPDILIADGGRSVPPTQAQQRATDEAYRLFLAGRRRGAVECRKRVGGELGQGAIGEAVPLS